MTAVDPPSACPGCLAAPLAQQTANYALAGPNQIVLSLPAIHCAGCISGVERGLNAVPGVRHARVNLSRKRVTIDAAIDVTAQQMVEALHDIGYEARALDSDLIAATDTDAIGRDYLMRLAIAGFAMMNVMLFSVAVWSGASDSTRNLFHWISAGIAVPTIIFSAQPFYRSAWAALRSRRLNMDVPISLAIGLAGAMSFFETTQNGDHVYFDAALSLTFFLLIGRYLDHRTRMAARSAARELSALEVSQAVRVTDGKRETVPLSALRVGDHIAVAAGVRIPVDGTLIDGVSDIDRSFLTGESLPVSVSPGAGMAAGEVNLTGPLIIQATAVGDDITLRQMAAMVEVAEGARNRYTALADRAARIYAPAVHLLALIAFTGWLVASGDVRLSLNIAIAVLIITCPCALGLAVPAVSTAASGRLFRRGFLVKDGTALERLAAVDTVVFDKTGTLTKGRVNLDAGTMTQAQMGVLLALAQTSAHPVSRAIAYALSGRVAPAPVTDVKEVSGHGIQAKWNGNPVRLGRADWVGGDSSPAFRIGAGESHAIGFAEDLRDGARQATLALQAQGLDVHIFTGDQQDAADKLAADLGVSQVRAGMLPADKVAAITALGASGANVLMIGDGLNDTAALAAAHVSIAPASALDASRTVSDIVLLSESLHDIPDALTTARSARARVHENFAIAAGYNLIAVPIALAGFASPLMAALAMSLSSITVLLNALRVR